MAKKDTLNPALPLLVGSKPSENLKPGKEKPKVKPKVKPAAKPAAKPVLDSNYKFVFDPSGWQSHEAQAVRALYADHTGGQDLAAQPDPQEALKVSGVIHAPTSSKGRALDHGATSHVYVSGQDALDALSKTIGSSIGQFTAGDVIATGLFGPGAGVNLNRAAEPISNLQVPIGIRGTSNETPSMSVGEALKAPFQAVGALHDKFAAATKTGPNVAGRPAGARPVGASNTAGLKSDSGMITRPVASGIQKSAELFSAMPILYGSSAPVDKNYFSAGDINVKAEDIAAHTNKYIDAASNNKSYLVSGDPAVKIWTDQIINGGALPEEIGPQMQSAKDQQQWSGFPEPDILAMQRRAADNGWAFDPMKPGGSAAWRKLTPAEWLYYAYSKNDYGRLFGRSLLRAVALTGLAPAGIAGMAVSGVKAAGGDTKDAEAMIAGALAPVKTFQSDSEKYGVGVAFKNAFRDHPDQVVLALWTAGRAIGSVGGVAARAGAFGKTAAKAAAKHAVVEVPGEGVVVKTYVPPIPPTVETPFVPLGTGGVGSHAADLEAARIQAQVASDAAHAADVASGKIKGVIVESPPINAPVEIGVTGGNLWDILFLRAGKARLARKSPRYRARLASGAAEAKVRRQYNVEQGMQIEIRAALSRPFGRAPTSLELDRAAFNLMWPAISLVGEKISPAWVSKQFRKAIDEYKVANAEGFNIPNATTGVLENRAKHDQQVRLWENQAAYYDQLNSVAIPDATMAELRVIAKPMGAENTRIIAEMMKEDVSAVERANYIRLVASNNDLSVLSSALKESRNATRKSFIFSQHNVRRIARKYAEKVTPAGVGAKSRPKSIAAQAEQKASLVAALLEARDAALRVAADKSLNETIRQDASVAAREYSDAAARIGSSGAGVADRAAADAAVLAQIDSIALASDTVAGLPAEAQVAYSAAQTAEAARAAQADVVAGLEAKRVAALGEVAPLAGTQPLKSANTAAVRAAQARVDKAAKRVEDIQGRTLPSKKELTAARAELDAAQARLDRLGVVQQVDVSLAGAKNSLAAFTKTRDARVREVKAIIAKNKPVLDVEDVTISVDAAEGVAGIRIRSKKEYGFFTITQAKNEILDDFIARVQGSDQQALLHVMVTKDVLRPFEGTVYSGSRAIDTSATARVRSGRLIESQGILFKSGQEQAKFWERLLFDTAELKTAQAWQRKIQDLINATCIPIRPTQETLDKAAGYEADLKMSPQDALSKAVADEDIIKSANDFKVIRPSDPSAGVPSEGVSIGAARAVAPQTVEDMFLSHVGLDAFSNGDYLLMPRGVYDGIQDAIRNQSFRFTPGVLSKVNTATRVWRDLTLNIFPKTAFNNFVGSGILALMAGATPLDFLYAYRAIMGKVDKEGRVYAFPPELRQRYYEQLTTQIPTGLAAKLANTHATTETALGWVAYWMNSMRRLNGASEDLSRVAVWYSKARPAAIRDAATIQYFASMRSLTDDSMRVVEAMARNDPKWESMNDLFLQKSFDFLGDLHKGGQLQATIRLAIPFYQWYAHILKLTFFTMPLKYPGRALFLQTLGSVGEEYVKEHGVLPSGFDGLAPLFDGVIPFSTSTEQVAGAPQMVTMSVGSNSWWPQGTVSPLATQPLDTIMGSVNPLVKTPAIGLVSTIAGITGSGALNLKGANFLSQAKDENGNPITDTSGLFWWNINNASRIVPLMPSLFNLAGMADTSVPVIHERLRVKSGLQISNPSPNVSFWEAMSSPSISNSLTLAGRVFFGLNFTNVPGVGPIEAERYANAYSSQENRIKQETQNIADNLAKRHGG